MVLRYISRAFRTNRGNCRIMTVQIGLNAYTASLSLSKFVEFSLLFSIVKIFN